MCAARSRRVAPFWQDVGEKELRQLGRLHVELLACAAEQGLRTVALPAIGCGAHGFPPELAARAAVPPVEQALRDSVVDQVTFCFLSHLIHDAYASCSTGGISRGEALRAEILHELRGHADPALIDQVARASFAQLERIRQEVSKSRGDDSLSIGAVYAHAAADVFRFFDG